jgi:hypothetical protein
VRGGKRRGYRLGRLSGGPWAASRAGPKWLPEALFIFILFSSFLFSFSYLKIFKVYFDSKMIQTFLAKFKENISANIIKL